MIHTFTASATNTDQNRSKICDFVNNHSVKCQQMTLRTIGNTITIEGVINMNFDDLIEIAKEIPAKAVIVSCGGSTRVINLKDIALCCYKHKLFS